MELNEVPCTYSKTYAYPATVVQQDSGGVAQMENRCDRAGEDYVNNQCEAGDLKTESGSTKRCSSKVESNPRGVP